MAKPPAKSKVNESGNYTKPTMRKQLFTSIKAGGKGGALDKIKALEKAGIHVVHNPAKMGEGMAMLMGVQKKTA